jgi:hypothetical protein
MILLLAYFLNVAKVLAVDRPLYPLLNVVGSGLAGYASYLLLFWPFVILEGTWMLVSLVTLIRTFNGKKSPAGKS